MSVDLEDRLAVITGGASGIGLACARRFAERGARVLVADRDVDALADATVALHGRARQVIPLRCDVTSDADMEQLAEVAFAAGPVGILMLNAGVSAGGRLELVPAAEWLRLYDVNVVGVVRGLNAFIPGLIGSTVPARIVITGSSASFDVDERGVDAPYAATKHALLAVTRAYANRLAPHGIDVRLLAPGLTDTAFPRSSTVWTRDGTRISSDRPVMGADTAEAVADALLESFATDTLVVAMEDRALDALASFVTSAWRRSISPS